MKTNQLHQLLRSKLLIAIAMLLVSCALQGQTYRILKASNDPGSYADQDEVANVLSVEDLNAFNFWRLTSNMVGAIDGQEFTLSKVPGTCIRIHSSIPDFNNLGLNWINSNPGLKAVVFDVKNENDLNQLGTSADLLTQSNSIRYLVIQTFKELYPNADPAMSDAEGLKLVLPAIKDKLNTLYNKGTLVLFASINVK